MSTAILLSIAIEEYLASRQSRGIAPNTLRSDRTQLTRFLTVIGNIQTRSLEERHVDAFFATLGHQKESSRNLTLSKLRGFFRWCKGRDYMPRDLTTERRRIKEPEVHRTLIPLESFDDLLDAAEHPRDRIIVALGLYLFLRISEIQTLRVGDVDLDEGTINVTIHKTKGFDAMPICTELDGELRTWLAWYAAHIEAPMSPDMLLVPTKKDYTMVPGPTGGFVLARFPRYTLNPYKASSRPHHAIQRAMAKIGYGTRWEGGHTLRRSGARALFDSLRGTEGSDGALQQVKVMLHHKNVAMTEHYIGIGVERTQRDTRFRGKPMFRRTVVAADNVVEMKR